jgi:hypothetical protein
MNVSFEARISNQGDFTLKERRRFRLRKRHSVNTLLKNAVFNCEWADY